MSIDLPSTNWSRVEALATAVGAVITAIGIIVLRRQLQAANASLAEDKLQRLEAAKTAELQGYMSVIEYMQATDASERRRLVLSAADGDSFPETSREREAARDVCQRFQTVGILVARGLLPRELFATYWDDSISKCWETLARWVREERIRMAAPRYCDAFESLAESINCGPTRPPIGNGS